jgi:hypothetical protein
MQKNKLNLCPNHPCALNKKGTLALLYSQGKQIYLLLLKLLLFAGRKPPPPLCYRCALLWPCNRWLIVRRLQRQRPTIYGFSCFSLGISPNVNPRRICWGGIFHNNFTEDTHIFANTKKPRLLTQTKFKHKCSY